MARLRATGQAYVDFALTEPGLFRTAFASESSIRAPSAPGEAEPPDHPFRILTGCIDDLVATGVLAAQRREGVDEAAWAAVHGLATLFLDGALSALDAAQKQLVTDRLLDAFSDGIR
jgi:Tetracyclin repressor-like, C-terminal domain